VNPCWREKFRTQCARDRVLLRTADAQRVERPARAQALGPTKETLRMKRREFIILLGGVLLAGGALLATASTPRARLKLRS
jgi:hypothetical protein